jgi:hypothetical protein
VQIGARDRLGRNLSFGGGEDQLAEWRPNEDSRNGVVESPRTQALEEISTSRPDDVARQWGWDRVRDDRVDEPTGPFSCVDFGAVDQRGGDGKREPQNDEVQQGEHHPQVSSRPGA